MQICNTGVEVRDRGQLFYITVHTVHVGTCIVYMVCRLWPTGDVGCCGYMTLPLVCPCVIEVEIHSWKLK